MSDLGSEPTSTGRGAPPLPRLVDASTLGGLNTAGLAAAIRPLWEDAGPLAESLTGRWVGSWDEHLDVAAEAIAAMDDDTRARLLRSHPRIGADSAVLARRSALSWREQGGEAGDPTTGRSMFGAAATGDAGADARLDELNTAYERRFGFPFVEWVAGRPRAAIVAVVEARLAKERPEELAAGCAALTAIARDRLWHLRSAI